MAEQDRADRNRTRRFTLLYSLVSTVLLLNVLNEARYLWRGQRTMGNMFGLVVAIALLTLSVLARNQVPTGRDR